MRSIELFAIGLRLLGIYTLLLSADTATMLFQSMPNYVSAWNGEIPTLIISLAVAEVAAILIAGILLLKFPVSIARFLMPKADEADPILNGSAKDIQTAIFCVVGVYILSWAIPDLINNLLFWHAESKVTGDVTNSDYKFLTIVTLVELVIGFYLSLQAHGLSNLVWRLRGYKE